MIYGYARVSTKQQAKDGNSLQAQTDALRTEGAEQILHEAYTGKTKDRPVFDSLMLQLKGGDTLIVTKLDRIARSVRDGEEIITDLMKRGVTVKILNLGTIDDSPTGKLSYHMLLAFAEFERDMILQRTQEGKAVAREKPSYREGQPRTEQKRLDHAMELLNTHEHRYKDVSDMTGISVSTLTRERRRYKEKMCEKGIYV